MLKYAAIIAGQTKTAVLRFYSEIMQKPSSVHKTDTSLPIVQYEYQTADFNCACIVEYNPTGEEVFSVRIQGRIRTDQPGRRVNLNVKFDDITDSNPASSAVYAKPAVNGSSQLRPFDFTCDLGRLDKTETEIPDWLSVARIKTSTMLFARKGKKRLLLKGSVFCRDTSEEFAKCCCVFEYDNYEDGYIDSAENIERSRALAVTLAFSLCAADGKMYNCELEKIRAWAQSQLGPKSDGKAQSQLDKAMRKTIRFFKRGYKIDIEAMAKQLAQIAPAAQRYDIIEMCLAIVGSKGFISPGQIDMLKKLAVWLDIDQERFRQMAERLAPANIHQVKDMELIFGLGKQFTPEQTRQRLNAEYRKWNARVTNIDPNIQTQAEQMLNLITKARAQYIG
jgi:uncharacterized tellurite resistance protein B-like protein